MLLWEQGGWAEQVVRMQVGAEGRWGRVGGRWVGRSVREVEVESRGGGGMEGGLSGEGGGVEWKYGINVHHACTHACTRV